MAVPRLVRFLLGLVALGALGVVGTLAVIYHWANGITPGSVALSSLAFVCAFALVGIGRSGLRKKANLAIAVLLTGQVAWVVARIARAGGQGLQVCQAGTCDGRGQLWQRVPDERETARFGLYLSRLTGTMRGAEARHFDVLLDDRYPKLPDEWRGLPNALLLGRGQRLQWVPPGVTKAPCIVFLHGFGGELSLYLHAITSSELGRFVVVAPVLDNFGIWWSARGMDLVSETLDTLPPEADRSNVILVGLSNGGIGVSAMLAQPNIRSRIAGAVLLSGAGRVHTAARLDGVHLLAISGKNDPRFPSDYVEKQAVALRAAGADVELLSLDADHFLILTHAAEWSRAVYLMGTSSPGSFPTAGHRHQLHRKDHDR
jgi:predicted esterase